MNTCLISPGYSIPWKLWTYNGSSMLSQVRLSLVCLSSVTFVRRILSRLKFSAMFLRHFVPYPSADFHAKCTREKFNLLHNDATCSLPRHCMTHRWHRLSFFLPERVYVTFGYMLSQVRLSLVCLSSVTFLRRTQPVEIFGDVSTKFCTLAICWLSCKILHRSSQRNPSVWG